MRISDWSSDVCSSDLTPQLPRGTDIRNLPVAKAPEVAEKPSRFATRMISRPRDPTGATDRITAPGGNQSVDVVSSDRITRNLVVTGGVRYKTDERPEPQIGTATCRESGCRGVKNSLVDVALTKKQK